MAEHRDSPELEPDQTSGASAQPRRRLAGLVASPTTRKVALPRLMIAGAVVLAMVFVGVTLSSFLIRSVQQWVAGLPEHQIAFADIELSPPPEAWVLDGKARILEEVRSESRRGKTLPLLGLDLKELEKDLRRSPWIKDVKRVDASKQGRLVVSLEYRRPVALLGVDDGSRILLYPIDEEGVPLPVDAIDWASRSSPFQVKGISEPLIEIHRLKFRGKVQVLFGLPWKRSYTSDADSTDDLDETVLKAARLAQFLQGQKPTTRKGQPAPRFVTIRLPDEPGHPFVLIDSHKNQIRWGKAPGDEKTGDLTAESRWEMLLDWIDRQGPLASTAPRYLYFDRSGAHLYASPSSR